MKSLMLLNLLVFICMSVGEKQLKQVVILSRHNLRSPLKGDRKDITVKNWPKWDIEPGWLTAKGEKLEVSMGQYFAGWLQKEKLIAEKCFDDLYVYANTRQRTIATAKAFIKGFALCDTFVHYKGSFDPVFEATFKNGSDVIKKQILKDYQEIVDKLKLDENFQLLQKILDYSNSNNCKIYGKCNLAKDKNHIHNINVGKEPHIDGPLAISDSAIDTFIMEYYEGYPIDDITWGKISNDDWTKLVELFQSGLDVLFENSTTAARDISSLLVKNISNIFIEKSPKISLLVGHDVNLLTIMKALNLKRINLGEYEETPCGSKLVFQKWFDNETEENLMKIEMIYRTKDDMRNLQLITEDHPPKRHTLEIEGCNIDEQGYCKWNEFINVLTNLH